MGDVKIIDNKREIYELKKENIKHQFILSKQENSYYFYFVFGKHIEKEEVIRESFISLDPGIYPFLTGVSKNNSFVMDESNIKSKINLIDKINKSKLRPCKKKNTRVV